MKYALIIIWAALTALVPTRAQDMTVTGGEAAEGLDLAAVGELFRQSENGEAFEKKLNDPGLGINNLDLDENGEVDYIRVVEQADKEVRVLILQVPLDKDEFQDVATIEIDKQGSDYQVQIHGNEQIYGVNYYVYPPSAVVWASVGFVSWLYAPRYRPWRSPFYWGYYPRWYHPWRPVARPVYLGRTKRVTVNVNYRVHTTSRVRVTSVNRVYQPATSVKVKKPLRNPTTSQKSFQARSSKTVKSGGFGKQTTTSAAKVKGESGTAAAAKRNTVKVRDTEQGKVATKTTAGAATVKTDRGTKTVAGKKQTKVTKKDNGTVTKQTKSTKATKKKTKKGTTTKKKKTKKTTTKKKNRKKKN